MRRSGGGDPCLPSPTEAQGGSVPQAAPRDERAHRPAAAADPGSPRPGPDPGDQEAHHREAGLGQRVSYRGGREREIKRESEREMEGNGERGRGRGVEREGGGVGEREEEGKEREREVGG